MKTIKRITVKLVFLSVLFILLNIPFTAAYFSDIESSENNTFSVSSLDMEFTSLESDFAGSPLTPGDTATRSATIANVGALPFNYTQEYQFISGDSDLCDALQISVNGEPWSPLSGFSSSTATLSPSANNIYDYEVILPLGASSTLRNKTCTFNLAAKAWQVGGVYGTGFWDIEMLRSSVSSGSWPPPTPTLVSPADGTVAGMDSEWMNNPVMDWTDVAWSEPITYRYELSHLPATNPDGSFTTPVFTSGVLPASQIPAPGTPDGVYYWHARACDTTWGCGQWSNIWKLTVDQTIQVVQPGDVVINELMWMGSRGGPGGNDEWIELRNMTDRQIDLSGWQITKLVGSETLMLTISSGQIEANGYFLISYFDKENSSFNVDSDLVTRDVSLRNENLQIKLYKGDWTNAGNLIDTADDGDGAPLAGVNGINRQSMERNDTPGDGTQADSWHTCLDAGCRSTTFWDNEGNNYGTPKAANLSSNDPTTTPQGGLEVILIIPVLSPPVATDSASISVQPDPVATPSATIQTSPDTSQTTPSPSPEISSEPGAESLPLL